MGGSAGCDDCHHRYVGHGWLGSQWNRVDTIYVAVGGTDFDDVGTQATFWNTTNAAGTRESAIGYIPETTWNNSCAATATSANLSTVCVNAAVNCKTS